MLKIERDGRKTTFQIVEGSVQPLLSLEASERLGQVRILASDVVHQVTHTDPLPEDDPILKEYSDIFTGLGRRPGRHNIRIDESVNPVEHATP